MYSKSPCFQHLTIIYIRAFGGQLTSSQCKGFTCNIQASKHQTHIRGHWREGRVREKDGVPAGNGTHEISVSHISKVLLNCQASLALSKQLSGSRLDWQLSKRKSVFLNCLKITSTYYINSYFTWIIFCVLQLLRVSNITTETSVLIVVGKLIILHIAVLIKLNGTEDLVKFVELDGYYLDNIRKTDLLLWTDLFKKVI